MLELRCLEQEKGNLLSFPNWQLSQICSDLSLRITLINPLFFKNYKVENWGYPKHLCQMSTKSDLKQ